MVGANGSGKSCFLESVGFALGASTTDLRVNTLTQLSGDCQEVQDSAKKKGATNGVTTVSLRFVKELRERERSNGVNL